MLQNCMKNRSFRFSRHVVIITDKIWAVQYILITNQEHREISLPFAPCLSCIYDTVSSTSAVPSTGNTGNSKHLYSPSSRTAVTIRVSRMNAPRVLVTRTLSAFVLNISLSFSASSVAKLATNTPCPLTHTPARW